MARYIHCPACNKRMAAAAAKHSELYESIEGTALGDMHCDGACCDGVHHYPTPIAAGEKCFAAVLLNNRDHPNYPLQRPEAWAHEFINIKN